MKHISFIWHCSSLIEIQPSLEARKKTKTKRQNKKAEGNTDQKCDTETQTLNLN